MKFDQKGNGVIFPFYQCDFFHRPAIDNVWHPYRSRGNSRPPESVSAYYDYNYTRTISMLYLALTGRENHIADLFTIDVSLRSRCPVSRGYRNRSFARVAPPRATPYGPLVFYSIFRLTPPIGARPPCTTSLSFSLSHSLGLDAGHELLASPTLRIFISYSLGGFTIFPRARPELRQTYGRTYRDYSRALHSFLLGAVKI